MQQDVRYQKIMRLLNCTIREMKRDLQEVDKLCLKDNKKKMAENMHNIMKTLEERIKRYVRSKKREDLRSACRELEILQPSFSLNYNEICYDSGLDMLNNVLVEMRHYLVEVSKEKLLSVQERRAAYLQDIYNQLSGAVDQFARSREHADFKRALTEIERLRPEFILNYTALIAG